MVNLLAILNIEFPPAPFDYTPPPPSLLNNLVSVSWIPKYDPQATEGFVKAIKEAEADIEKWEGEMKNLNHDQKIIFLENKITINERVKGFPAIDNATKWLKRQLEEENKLIPPDLALKLKNAQNGFERSTDLQSPPDLIVNEKRAVFQMYENNIKDLIGKWKNKQEIELCAAFCNYLFQNNFFKTQKLAAAHQFALAKYGLKIASSIDKLRRKNNNELLNNKTEKVKRLILQTPYGKI